MRSLEEIEVLDSMKRVLDKINEKLKDETVLGDIMENERLKIKKVWVERKIKEWTDFIDQ